MNTRFITTTFTKIYDGFCRMGIVVHKELLGLFVTPVAYIVTVIFLGLSEFLFFKNVFLVGEASLIGFYTLLPWIYLFVIPALTMGTFAQERESGTYESLATQPLHSTDYVGGKYLAYVGYLLLVLALAVVPMAVSFSFFANLDGGAVVGGYLASALLISVFVAIGLWVSSLFTKQVSAFLVTVTILFALLITNTELVAGSVPVYLTLLMERIGVLSHYTNTLRGVIDVRDLWYTASVTAAFFALVLYRLVALKYSARHYVHTSARFAVVLVVITVLVSNVFGALIPGRFDLTEDQLYTLSDATKRTLVNAPDIVTLTLYVSSALPAQLKPVERNVRDMLKDYERYGSENVHVSIKDPASSPEHLSAAQKAGIQEVQFNVMGQGELSVKNGYLGVVVSYHGEDRAIPFIEKTDDLEYQLTSMVVELTATEKARVRFLSGNGERSRSYEYQLLSTELSKLYDVADVEPKEDTSPGDIDVLVVADPKTPLSTTTQEFLATYLTGGGAVLAVVPGVHTDTRALTGTKNLSDVLSLLNKYGITVEPTLAYDLRSNETVQLRGGRMIYLAPYPFWIRAGVLPHPITTKMQSVMVPWGSPLSLREDVLLQRNATATALIVTSQYAGTQGEPYIVAPDQTLSTEQLGVHTLAYAISGNSTSSPRLVVIGSGDFLSDEIAGRDGANIAFGLGAVAWLAQGESLASIKLKSGNRRVFSIDSAGEQLLLTYGNMGVVVAILLFIGLTFALRRRAKKNLTYSDRPLL